MLNKELVIHVDPTEISIALLEDKALVEMNQELRQTNFAVGDIYLGKVKKIMSGLNAAFVDVGYEKDAFLHYLDLGPQIESLNKLVTAINVKHKEVDFRTLKLQGDITRQGKISQIVTSGQPIMVQVAKEPISMKGPRLTAEISIAGRHIVLMPFTNKISVSQKIKTNAERKRLRELVAALLPNNYGAIIRTAAEGKETTDLQDETISLIEKWEHCLEALKTQTPPSLLQSEMNRTTTILRDLLSGEFSSIHIDDENLYHEVREYISTIEPDKEKIVKLYKGNIPIFDNFDVTKQIKSHFGKTVPFKRGAYLIVEHTEALHVIDVNSGTRTRNFDNHEEVALEVNLNAVPEIARQLRLKDMGGIIVIDFIDLHKPESKNKLYAAMKEAMSADRAKHNVLPLSKFGLMQITRQRVRPQTQIEITDTCPTCRGTGKISPSVLIDKQIENQIAYLVREKHYKYLKLHTHPFVAAYLNQGLFSKHLRWILKYQCYIKLIPDASIDYVNTKFYSIAGTEL